MSLATQATTAQGSPLLITLILTLLAATTLSLILLRRQRLAVTASAKPRDNPPRHELTAAQLAYLSHGQRGLVYMQLRDMTRRGWLRWDEEQSATRAARHVWRDEAPAPLSVLSPMEIELWRALEGGPHEERALFGAEDLPGRLELFGEAMGRELVARGLLYTDEARARQHGRVRAAQALALGLGAWATLVALPLSIAASVALAALTGGAMALLGAQGELPWQTPSGAAQLGTWRATYEPMRQDPERWRALLRAHLPYLDALFLTPP